MIIRQNRYLTLSQDTETGVYTIDVNKKMTETFTDIREANEVYDIWCVVYFKERNQ